MFDVKRLEGIIPPLATPLTEDEELDESGLRRLIRRVLEAGCHGVFILGGTGEGIYLSDQVQTRTIGVTVDEVAGRVPVIVGVSDVSVKRSVIRGKEAAQLGAEVLISVPPYQRLMEPQEVYDYYISLAEGTGMPTMLYNVPPDVRTDISVETIARLAEHSRIVGMKDSADFGHLASVAFHTKGTSFRLLCGVEHNLVPAIMVGAVGGTMAKGNLWPRLCIDTYNAAVANNWEESRAMQEKLTRFAGRMSGAPWVALCKYALNLMGICGATVMRPQRALDEREQRLAKSWLGEYGLIA